MVIELVKVAREDQWTAYHHIRRLVLFERRGLEGYDENHPDDVATGHIPLLLCRDNLAIGTVRLDLQGNDVAIVRLVAIMPEHQRRGFGRILMAELEILAAKQGVVRLEVSAARDAVPFYRKLGWTLLDGEAESPLMGKTL